MHKVVIIHSQPKSKSDFALLATSKLAICFLAENDLPYDLRILLSKKVIYLNEEEIYSARERSKDIWNTRIVTEILKRKNYFLTNSGASRSEFSTVIQAFHAWNAIEKYLGKQKSYVQIITENKDLLNIANFHNRAFFKLFKALLQSGIYSLISTFKRLAIDSFYFSILKTKRTVVAFKKTPFVAFSMLKHWSRDGDWRYGHHFCKYYHGSYAVSCMRAGGLQNHKFFVWNKLVNKCLRAKQTIIIERLVTWPQFFICLFSAVRLQIGLFLRTLSFLLTSRKNICYVDLLLVLEENKHFSEMFSNELIYLGSTNYYKNIATTKAVLYHFEFPAGRAFISAAKYTGVPEVIGLQHGVISKGKWCYELGGMLSNGKHSEHCTPHFYLLEGALSWWVLSKTVKSSKIRLVGAPRQDSFRFINGETEVPKTSGNFHLDSSCYTVLLMDLHTTQQKLIEHIKTISMKMGSLRQIFIRPHPRDIHADIKIERAKRFFSKLNFECLTNSLRSDLERLSGLTVYGESTGALLDCMGLGMKVKVLRVRNSLMLDPILDIEMNLKDINNFILRQGFENHNPLSLDNPNGQYNLLFHSSSKPSSALILDSLCK